MLFVSTFSATNAILIYTSAVVVIAMKKWLIIAQSCTLTDKSFPENSKVLCDIHGILQERDILRME